MRGHESIERADMRYVVIALFLGSVVVRTLLNGFMKHASTYDDEWIYLQSAYDVAHGYGFGTIYGLPYGAPAIKRVLYIALIAPACLATNMQVRFILIALINSTLLSLGIFPIHYLSQHLIRRKDLQLLVLLIYVLMPFHNLGIAFMSDIALFPLATTIMCISLSLVRWQDLSLKGRVVHVALLAICLPLAFITKPAGAIFIAPVGISLVAGLFLYFRNAASNSARPQLRTTGIILLFASLLVILLLFVFFRQGEHSLLDIVLMKTLRMLRPETLKDASFPLTFAYQTLTALLALEIFPFIVPPIARRTFNAAERIQITVLLLTILLFVFVVASYMHIPGKSFDPTSDDSRVLFRYYSFLFMPVMVFFVATCERLATQALGKVARYTLIIVVLFMGVTIGLWYRGNLIGSVTDGEFLYFWQSFAEDTHAVVLVVTLVSLALLTFLLICKPRLFTISFFALWFALQIFNNVCSYTDYHDSYALAADDSIQDLRQFVLEHNNDTFLLLEYKHPNPSVRSVPMRYGDTYLDTSNVERVSVSSREQLYEENEGSLDLTQTPVGPHALTHVDYLIISNELDAIPVDGAQLISLGNNNWYTLYKLDNSSVIPRLKRLSPE